MVGAAVPTRKFLSIQSDFVLGGKVVTCVFKKASYSDLMYGCSLCSNSESNCLIHFNIFMSCNILNMENRGLARSKNYMNNSLITVSAIRKVLEASERSDFSWKMADSILGMVWEFCSTSDMPQTAQEPYSFLMMQVMNEQGWIFN